MENLDINFQVGKKYYKHSFFKLLKVDAQYTVFGLALNRLMKFAGLKFFRPTNCQIIGPQTSNVIQNSELNNKKPSEASEN